MQGQSLDTGQMGQAHRYAGGRLDQIVDQKHPAQMASQASCCFPAPTRRRRSKRVTKGPGGRRDEHQGRVPAAHHINGPAARMVREPAKATICLLDHGGKTGNCSRLWRPRLRHDEHHRPPSGNIGEPSGAPIAVKRPGPWSPPPPGTTLSRTVPPNSPCVVGVQAGRTRFAGEGTLGSGRHGCAGCSTSLAISTVGTIAPKTFTVAIGAPKTREAHHLACAWTVGCRQKRAWPTFGDYSHRQDGGRATRL